MSIINTNTKALIAQNHLKKTQSSLNQTIERLSSGLRINSAKDDAAGQAIANRMSTNIRANNQISRGINDGISLTQTAEGGLEEINNMLQRSRQLAVQALNDTLSNSDRAAVHSEFVQLRTEIDRIAAQTEIFGKYPLARPRDNPPEPPKLGDTLPATSKFPVNSGTVSFSSGVISVAYIPKEATNIRLEINDRGLNDDIQIFTTSGKHIVGTRIEGNQSTWEQNNVTKSNFKDQVLTTQNGFNSDAVYNDDDLLSGEKSDPNAPFTGLINDMNVKYSGDGNRQNGGPDLIEYVEIDEIKEDLILLVTGRGAFNATLSWDSMPELQLVPTPPNPPPYSYPIEIATSANYGDELKMVTINPTPSDSKSLGIDTTALDPYELAELALSQFDQALEKINTYRGEYGAMHNSFNSISTSLATQTLNLEAARSRIQDADYAQEVSNMTKSQILQQAGNTVLAQANQIPEGVLSLLS